MEGFCFELLSKNDLFTLEDYISTGTVDVNCGNPDWYDETLLHRAIIDKNIRAVKLMLRYGADINIHNEMNYSAIDQAIATGDDEIIDLIMNMNPEITPHTLDVAIIFADEPLIKFVMEKVGVVNESQISMAAQRSLSVLQLVSKDFIFTEEFLEEMVNQARQYDRYDVSVEAFRYIADRLEVITEEFMNKIEEEYGPYYFRMLFQDP